MTACSASPEPLWTSEVEVAPPSLPEALASQLEGYSFVSLVRSYSAPSEVYRATRVDSPTFYLKVGAGLHPEHERLCWLQSRLKVPQVELYTERDNDGFLLLTEIQGQPADAVESPRAAVLAVAQAMRALHAIPAAECPFGAYVEDLVKTAAEVVRQGLVHSSDLSQQYRHLSPEEVLQRALHLYPANGSLVVTHGDCCLPNFLVAAGKPVGMVDLGLAGLSDPWRDLALMARSIRRNLGEEWVAELFVHYGVEVDEPRMEFFALLDQLTMMRGRVSRTPG